MIQNQKSEIEIEIHINIKILDFGTKNESNNKTKKNHV